MTYRFRPLITRDLGSLIDYVQQALMAVSVTVEALSTPTVTLYIEPPTRPRDGMVVRADGVHWNPGGGRGFYGYDDGSWIKIGQ